MNNDRASDSRRKREESMSLGEHHADEKLDSQRNKAC